MGSKHALNVKNKGNLVVIRFPITALHALFPLLSVVFVILPATRYSSGNASAFDNIVAAAVFSYMLLSYLMLFMRKLTIDKDKETVTYYSLYSRTFAFHEIVSLKCETISDDESISHHLLIKLHNKTIKVRTRSDKQSELLQTELVALTNNGRLAFRQ